MELERKQYNELIARLAYLECEISALKTINELNAQTVMELKTHSQCTKCGECNIHMEMEECPIGSYCLCVKGKPDDVTGVN